MEVGITYELIGPDGTRAVTGNNDDAKADPDYIGPLDPDSGITGLLDTAGLRESVSELVEGDGASQGPSWLGRRVGTMQGLLLPDQGMDVVNVAESRLKRASRALRAEATLRWTPTGESSPRMLRVRRQGTGGPNPAVTGRRPKAWQLALASTDPYVLSASEQDLTITPDAAGGELGISDPITDPVTSPYNVTGATIVTNDGDAPTWPRFRINGPITNPELLNNTTGLRVALDYDLADGDYLDVYPERGAIVLNGTADRYSALDFDASDWWPLEPGANDVRLLAEAYSAGANVIVYWRHAWE